LRCLALLISENGSFDKNKNGGLVLVSRPGFDVPEISPSLIRAYK
jgi:hypothetical protein